MTERLHVLLIAGTVFERIGTTGGHIAALTRLPHHRVVKVDHATAHLMDMEEFDVIVLHYSLCISMSAYIPPLLREKITKFPGLKVLFIQDEYRWIDATAQAIRDLGIRVVFSVLNPSIIKQVYHHSFLADVRFESTLTGYVVPELLTRAVPDYARRPIDVGYRARKVPAWLGSLGLLKWRIAEKFAADAPRYGLKCDISTGEEDRLYSERWIRFVSACKACLGTESAVSIFDYTDEIRTNVEAYLDRHPDAAFDELSDRFFRDVDGRLSLNVISPRCFEAAALRTLMVMYPGEYSGILQAGRHYVPLALDHSNMDEVVAIIRSPERAQAIIDCAYREIACCDDYSFAALTRHLDRVLCEEGYRVRPPLWQRTMSLQEKLRLRLAQKTALIGARLRMNLAERAMRVDRMMAAAAKRGLPERSFERFERGMRRLRRTAKRLILRIQ